MAGLTFALYSALMQGFKDATVIVVTHRSSFDQFLDRKFEIRDGGIFELPCAIGELP